MNNVLSARCLFLFLLRARVRSKNWSQVHETFLRINFFLIVFFLIIFGLWSVYRKVDQQVNQVESPYSMKEITVFVRKYEKLHLGTSVQTFWNVFISA